MKMKKLVALIVIVSMILTLAKGTESKAGTVSRNDGDEQILSIEYLENGGYVITTIENITENNRSQVTKSKKKTFYSSAGVAEWAVKVKGTFTYDGTTSSCLSDSVTTYVYSGGWSITNSSSSHYSNVASASATAVIRDSSGAVFIRETMNVSLTCSANGEFY